MNVCLHVSVVSFFLFNLINSNHMNKFTKNLSASNKEIKGKRAIMFGEDALAATTALVQREKSAERDISRTIMDLEDLSPNYTTSLNPVKSDFNAKQWVEDLWAAKVKLRLQKVKVSEAEDILKHLKTISVLPMYPLIHDVFRR